MITSRGTTPTYILTFPEDIDFTGADEVIVTFADTEYNTILEKSGADLTINENVIEVFLDQAETLSFTQSRVLLQVNWTYTENNITKRCASDIQRITPVRNLVNEEIE